ncbi:dTDP-4-dehydrorhamnose 3,5-epimerase [Fulvivirgaceae bacterium PWU4]|uniref:dTDP-4-dehydrorhamnose 3,5-epimerase n=1 Tax=Chryseosolibacter histidini TaxID=2782349 RepID=A0AAP2DTM0_9BACT|nr:dTDP-4-dehydrorhamnose 3,5-epimerase [Chryseosolibacter histidini]MBT1700349.1 dTDP-4-dehydrorhamnose 3,5-epimerase [Chryseosolibacter histidini]
MIFTETKLKGAFIIDVKRLEDERGFFARVWCRREYEQMGLNAELVQASMSYNKQKGTLRGLHFQMPPYAETKIVRCTSGMIYDVIVDLRPESETYLQWISVELSGENARMLYVPEGFAHGFITLEDHTSIQYMAGQYYTSGAETGIRYDDPALNIHWPVAPSVISERDLRHQPYHPVLIQEKITNPI